MKIKKLLKSNAFGRWLFPKIGFFWHLYSDPRRRRALQKYGYSHLKELVEISEKEGITLIPWAGTLLGFVRDGGFMKHDNDVDMAVLPSKSPKEAVDIMVNKYGYQLIQGLSYHGKVRVCSFMKKGLSVDFYFMFDDGTDFFKQYDFFWKDDFEYNDSRQNHVGLYSYPRMDKLTTMVLNNIEIKIPANIEEELYYLYGKGWKVPDPNYKGEGRPGRLGTADDLGYSMTYDEVINDRIPEA